MVSKLCVQYIIKQLLDSVFVISRIIKVSVRVISLSLRFRYQAEMSRIADPKGIYLEFVFLVFRIT